MCKKCVSSNPYIVILSYLAPFVLIKPVYQEGTLEDIHWKVSKSDHADRQAVSNEECGR